MSKEGAAPLSPRAKSPTASFQMGPIVAARTSPRSPSASDAKSPPVPQDPHQHMHQTEAEIKIPAQAKSKNKNPATEEVAKTPDFAWFRATPLTETYGIKRLILMFVVPMVIVFLLALVSGVVMNKECFNGASGGAPSVGESTGEEINVLKISMLSWLVAAVLLIARFLVGIYAHVRIRGIFRFTVYLSLSVALIAVVFAGQFTVVTDASSAQMSDQIQQMFGGYFNYAQYQFAYTFGEIVTVNDFYNWMRGPFLGVVTSGALNRLDHSKCSNLPTQLNEPNITREGDQAAYSKSSSPSYGVWAIPSCSIRQVRTDPVEMDTQTFKQTWGYDDGVSSDLTATYSFSHKYNKYEDGDQSKSARDLGFGLIDSATDTEVPDVTAYIANLTNTTQTVPIGDTNAALHEHYVNNEFTTAWGMKRTAYDFTSGKAELLSYPGKSGQVPTVYYTDTTASLPFAMYKGTYRPMSIAGDPSYPVEVFADRVENDLKMLENNRWVDAGTALVMVECNLWNPNNNVMAFSYYAVEFLPSGKVLPNEPIITIAPWNSDNIYSVDIALVFAYYYLTEELTEFIEDPSAYFVKKRNGHRSLNFVNFLDIGACVGTFAMSMMRYQTMSMATSAESAHYWSMAMAQDYLGIITGVALFLVLFKAMKYTRKVPIMCIIHNTFADTVWKITVFLFLLVIIFLAFAMMFMNMYSLKMLEFGTFRQSFLAMFQLMNGDLDVDALVTHRPLAGAILYVIYLLLTVFLAFTILIAIIGDSYERTKDLELDRKSGLLTLALDNGAQQAAKLMALATAKLELGAEEEAAKSEEAAEEEAANDEALHQSIALILAKIEQLEQRESERESYIEELEQRIGLDPAPAEQQNADNVPAMGDTPTISL